MAEKRMKIFLLRGVFYRNEKNEEDRGRGLAKGFIEDMPEDFAQYCIAGGRARVPTPEDIETDKANRAALAKSTGK